MSDGSSSACLSIAKDAFGRCARGDTGTYEILGTVANGGMASIALARDEGKRGRAAQVVVKQMSGELAEDKVAVGYFRQEARILGLCDHPNIVRRLDVGRMGDAPFTVMEHIEGATLSQVVRLYQHARRLVPLEVVAKVAVDLLDALDHVHNRRSPTGAPYEIVHRDVCPMNVMLRYDGRLKLLDFGVATLAGGEVDPKPTTLRGKIPYVSPEQFRGEALDQQCDLWAVGVVLWELLAGRKLFDAIANKALLSQILREPIPSIVDQRADVPDQLAVLLGRLLTRDRQRRFPSAAKARRAFAAFAAGMSWELSDAALADALADLRSAAGYGHCQPSPPAVSSSAPPRTKSGPPSVSPASRRSRAPGPRTDSTRARVVPVAVVARPRPERSARRRRGVAIAHRRVQPRRSQPVLRAPLVRAVLAVVAAALIFAAGSAYGPVGGSDTADPVGAGTGLSAEK